MATQTTAANLLLLIDDQGGGCISYSTKGLSPSLRSQIHGHPPLILVRENKKNGETDNTDRKKVL